MENQKQKEDREKRDKEIADLYPQLTLMEIGKKYDLTRGRVSQIINKQNETNKGSKKNNA